VGGLMIFVCACRDSDATPTTLHFVLAGLVGATLHLRLVGVKLSYSGDLHMHL